MKKNSLLSAALILTLTFTMSLPVSAGGAKEKKAKNPKNVILLIGDGMGLAQVYAAYTAACGNLNITSIDHIALVKTNSASNYITDSGAGGTAIACGEKTTNGMIGMTPEKVPLTSILKHASAHKLSTGIVATSDVTHATPASFVASVESRKMAEHIAYQYHTSGIDVFIGGGSDHFIRRSDNLNLFDSLQSRNFQVVQTIPAMMEVKSGRMAALLYPEHPPKISEGRGDMLSLSTDKAISLLSQNRKGFFLMIEGSQIDWGGHDNNIGYVVNEALDFDKAVGIALDFAKKNGETLVIVTADHETGGLSNLEGDFTTGHAGGKFITDDHSGIPVPLFAYGPGSHLFKGLMENTEIFFLAMKALGLNQ